jgi:fumarate hydratase class II
MLPVIAYNLLKSINLMANSMPLLANKAIKTFKVNNANIAESLGKNPILVTALNREIGYEKAAQIAKKAYKEKEQLLMLLMKKQDYLLKLIKAFVRSIKTNKGGV